MLRSPVLVGTQGLGIDIASSDEKRSGARSAASIATQPPQSWPTRRTRSRPSASSSAMASSATRCLVKSSSAGGARPAEAAHVGAQEPVLAGELADHVPPRPPVLRPAVQAQHRRGVGWAGRGEVHAHAGGQIVVAVLDACDLGHGWHGATPYLRYPHLPTSRRVRGFSLPGASTTFDPRSAPTQWPVETSGSPSPSRARSASAGTTRPTSPSGTTPIASALRKYCKWCRQHTGHRETR